MATRGVLMSRMLLVAGSLLLACSAPTSPRAAAENAPTPSTQGSDPQAYFHPEVRLRKLHLVRPDLIPYPIAYEVYC